MVTKTIDIDQLIEAKQRGAQYLLGRQRDDGAVGDPSGGLGAYYKAPWALAAAGHSAAAPRTRSATTTPPPHTGAATGATWPETGRCRQTLHPPGRP